MKTAYIFFGGIFFCVGMGFGDSGSLGFYKKVLLDIAAREGVEESEPGKIIDALLDGYSEKMNFPFNEDEKYHNFLVRTIHKAIDECQRLNKAINEEEIVTNVLREVSQALDAASVFGEVKKKGDDKAKYLLFGILVTIGIVVTIKYYLDQKKAQDEQMQALAEELEQQRLAAESKKGGFFQSTLGAITKLFGVASLSGGVAYGVSKLMERGSNMPNMPIPGVVGKKCSGRSEPYIPPLRSLAGAV